MSRLERIYVPRDPSSLPNTSHAPVCDSGRDGLRWPILAALLCILSCARTVLPSVEVDDGGALGGDPNGDSRIAAAGDADPWHGDSALAGDEVPPVTLWPGELLEVQAPPLSGRTRMGRFSVASDDNTVFFIGNAEAGTGADLYAVDATARFVRRLNAALPADSSVQRYVIGHDELSVFYTAQNHTGDFELRAVATTGGSPATINGPFVRHSTGHGYGVNSIWAARAAPWLVYRAHGISSDELDSYAVSADGSSFAAVSPSRMEFAAPSSMAISDDGAKVAYYTETNILGVATSQGTGFLTLHNAFGAGGLRIGGRPRFVQGGAMLLFERYTNSSIIFGPSLAELHGFAVDGSSHVQFTTGAQSVLSYAVTTDGAQLVVLGDLTVPGVYELHNTTMSGTGTLRSRSGSVHGFRLSPDDARIVFSVAVAGGTELHSMPFSGGTSVRLSPASPGDVETYAFSGDSQRVVYVYRDATTGVPDIFSVPSDGATAAQPFAVEASAGMVFLQVLDHQTDGRSPYPALHVARDGGTVFYHAQLNRSADIGAAIYKHVLGAQAVQLSPTQRQMKPVFADAVLSPDGTKALLMAAAVGGVEHLYCIDSTFAAGMLQLDATLPNNDPILTFEFTPDSQKVIFTTAQGRLYASNLVPGVPPARLNADSPLYSHFSNNITFVAVAADSSTVVYRAMSGLSRLYAAPTDGAQAAYPLHGTLGDSEFVERFKISRDSTRVVYSLSGTGVAHNVFTVPLSGGGATQLTAETTAGHGVTGKIFLGAGDGQVVFRSFHGLTNPTRYSLRVVATDGASAPRTLGPDVFRGDMWVHPDSGLAICKTRWDGSTVRATLWAVPLDGAAPYRLHGYNNGNFGANKPVLSPTGSHVMVEATYNVQSRWEFFSASVDDALDAVVHGAVIGGRVVRDAFFAADGSQVFYVFDETEVATFDLYAAELDGSQRRRLTGPYAPGGRLLDYEILRSNAVVFHATQDNVRRGELFAINADGNGLRKLSPPMIDGGRILRFKLSPDELSVVFLAQTSVFAAPKLYRSRVDASQLSEIAVGSQPLEVVSDFIPFDHSVVVYSNFHEIDKAHLFGYGE